SGFETTVVSSSLCSHFGLGFYTQNRHFYSLTTGPIFGVHLAFCKESFSVFQKASNAPAPQTNEFNEHSAATLQQSPSFPSTEVRQRVFSPVVVFGGGFLALMAGIALVATLYDVCSSATFGSATTKGQWRERFCNAYPFARQTGGPGLQTSASDFASRVGKPDSTQTVGSEAYWYYRCSDGDIQVALSADYLNMGRILIIAVNDY
ncbi:MAG: hypothetical protein PHV34_17140, partial [Verrucomicrobiae bacterium]|nr:hypothetical protein [Verrucomicrobiae bacterium]